MGKSKLFKEISSLDTEKNNPMTVNIDILSTKEILTIINNQDKLVPTAVEQEIENIELAVENIVASFKQGGRLFYFGAGTSGRLGIVDASECPPTFGTNPDMVQGVIAGGDSAVFRAVEGAEDKLENGIKAVQEKNIFPPDIVCGIAASGRTPFVKGALKEASERNCKTILITTSSRKKAIQLGIKADIIICPEVGPEVIAGSTRMKSGTAQKLVLNMLTTASMIKLGKTFGNVMVDLQLTNNKLKERAKKIIMELTGVSYQTAVEKINQANGNVKTALVMILADVDFTKAQELLLQANGFVKKAVEISVKNC